MQWKCNYFSVDLSNLSLGFHLDFSFKKIWRSLICPNLRRIHSWVTTLFYLKLIDFHRIKKNITDVFYLDWICISPLSRICYLLYGTILYSMPHRFVLTLFSYNCNPFCQPPKTCLRRLDAVIIEKVNERNSKTNRCVFVRYISQNKIIPHLIRRFRKGIFTKRSNRNLLLVLIFFSFNRIVIAIISKLKLKKFSSRITNRYQYHCYFHWETCF